MPSRLYDFACDRSARVVVCLLLWTGVDGLRLLLRHQQEAAMTKRLKPTTVDTSPRICECEGEPIVDTQTMNCVRCGRSATPSSPREHAAPSSTRKART
jgi:hypothetical protein